MEEITLAVIVVIILLFSCFISVARVLIALCKASDRAEKAMGYKEMEK